MWLGVSRQRVLDGAEVQCPGQPSQGDWVMGARPCLYTRVREEHTGQPHQADKIPIPELPSAAGGGGRSTTAQPALPSPPQAPPKARFFDLSTSLALCEFFTQLHNKLNPLLTN